MVVIKVLAVRVGKEPAIEELPPKLDAMQKFVGGSIEGVFLDRTPQGYTVSLTCNEEGKLLELPPNRYIKNTAGVAVDAVCGDFFICMVDDEGAECSIAEPHIAKYAKMFSLAESAVL